MSDCCFFVVGPSALLVDSFSTPAVGPLSQIFNLVFAVIERLLYFDFCASIYIMYILLNEIYIHQNACFCNITGKIVFCISGPIIGIHHLIISV